MDLAPVRLLADSILYVGYPGQSGGTAVANSLFNLGAIGGPSGRLTMTWHTAPFVNESNYTSYQMKAAPAPPGELAPGLPGRTYRYYKGSSVAFGFGAGESYSTFSEAWASANHSLSATELHTTLEMPASDQSPATQLSCVVTNTGRLPAAHIVIATAAHTQPPAFATIDGAPIKSVVGFERVFLQPGAVVTVHFNITADTFSQHAEGGGTVVMRGQWEFSFLSGQADGLATTVESTLLRVNVVN